MLARTAADTFVTYAPIVRIGNVANRIRQQRWRNRQKHLRAGYRCDADGAVLDMLIRRHYLDDNEADDVVAVSEAITIFLADHAALDDN